MQPLCVLILLAEVGANGRKLGFVGGSWSLQAEVDALDKHGVKLNDYTKEQIGRPTLEGNKESEELVKALAQKFLEEQETEIRKRVFNLE